MKNNLFLYIFIVFILFSCKSNPELIPEEKHIPDNDSGTAAENMPISDSANKVYILNTIGSSEYSSEYWNPHSVNLTNAEWDIHFGDRVTMFLNNNAAEFGHIACGSWWNVNFLTSKKLPLVNVKSLLVSVDLYISKINYSPGASLRMAVVSAITKSRSLLFLTLYSLLFMA